VSTQVTTAFVEQYKNNVALLMQQKGSLLRNFVTVDSAVVGKNKFTEQIGATAAIERTSRHGDSPLMDTPHARRRLSLADYEWGDLIDDADKVRMLIDPTSSYAQSAAWAMGRAMDDVILAAINGEAATGVAGGTDLGLSDGVLAHASNQLVDKDYGEGSDTNLTLAKLQRAQAIFQENNVDPDEEKFIAVKPAQIQALLQLEKATSADYTSVKALLNGEINTYMGFTFIINNRVGSGSTYQGDAGDSTSTTDHCICWVRSGVELGIGADIKARISERPDKAYSTYVYYAMSIGCTRLEEEKVVQIDCVNTAGLG